MSEPIERPPRCVYYVGFRDDRYWNAFRIFGGPRVIHRRWDWYAVHDVGPDDVVIFAAGDETQAMAEWNATDIDGVGSVEAAGAVPIGRIRTAALTAPGACEPSTDGRR